MSANLARCGFRVLFDKRIIYFTLRQNFTLFFHKIEFSQNKEIDLLSLNSQIVLNSENQINHWSINWCQFKVLVSNLWLGGWVARFFLITQEVTQSNSYDYPLHFGKTQTVRINSEVVFFFKNVSMKKFMVSSLTLSRRRNSVVRIIPLVLFPWLVMIKPVNICQQL